MLPANMGASAGNRRAAAYVVLAALATLPAALVRSSRAVTHVAAIDVVDLERNRSETVRLPEDARVWALSPRGNGTIDVVTEHATYRFDPRTRTFGPRTERRWDPACEGEFFRGRGADYALLRDRRPPRVVRLANGRCTNVLELPRREAACGVSDPARDEGFVGFEDGRIERWYEHGARWETVPTMQGASAAAGSCPFAFPLSDGSILGGRTVEDEMAGPKTPLYLDRHGAKTQIMESLWLSVNREPRVLELGERLLVVVPWNLVEFDRERRREEPMIRIPELHENPIVVAVDETHVLVGGGDGRSRSVPIPSALVARIAAALAAVTLLVAAARARRV